MSFALGGRFRAEIYIDRGDQSQIKSLFDALRQDSGKIDKEFGEPLEWERLPDGRASRIAIYKQGSIDAAPPELVSLRYWVISHLLKFKEVFGPRIQALDVNLVQQRP